MKSTDELNTSSGLERLWTRLRTLVRRMVITLTGTASAARSLWQVTGVRALDGKIETFRAEVFQGIGFYARPPASGKPEAIVVMIGGDGEAPAIVGVRDEATRQAIAGALKANEAMAFNSLAYLHVKDTGDVVGKKPSESDDYVALKRDLTRLRNAIAAADSTSAATFKAAILAALDTPPAFPEGSKTLKGGH